MMNNAELITSDLLHNRNCFNYLRKLKLPVLVLALLPEPLADKMRVIHLQKEEEYKQFCPYGDLYTEFFDCLEDNIEEIYDKNREKLLIELTLIEKYQQSEQAAIDQSTTDFQKKVLIIKDDIRSLDNFILSIYDNDNAILENTYEVIKDITFAHTPVSQRLEKKILDRVSDKGQRVNLQTQSPAQAGSFLGRFWAMMSGNYKPQHTTSLATVRRYNSNKDSPVREFRFGTQGQRHKGFERVSPVFHRFLEVQAKFAAEETKITHIYFNYLARDRSVVQGGKEKALTRQLEALETMHPNVAVITLPAEKGLMAENDYKKTQLQYDCQQVKEQFLQIAQGCAKTLPKIKDFYISRAIRGKIFCDDNRQYNPQIERVKLEQLLNNSFQKLGLSKELKFSAAQRQAVWFDFTKFELPNYIIECLQPQSINFSCKDSIDRGGVASAYYNLIKSFEPGKTPMNREEFDRALHAAPTMVKARGMNNQLNIIWNAVDAYVNQHHALLRKNAQKAWLIEWRDFNCPPDRVDGLLIHRITEFKLELLDYRIEPYSKKQASLIDKAGEIINDIEKINNRGLSDRGLLLEAASRTLLMTLNYKMQSQTNINRYKELTDDCSKNPPKSYLMYGMIKVLIGVVFFLLTFGKKRACISNGIGTVKAGFEMESRKELQTKMKDYLQILSENKPGTKRLV